MCTTRACDARVRLRRAVPVQGNPQSRSFGLHPDANGRTTPVPCPCLGSAPLDGTGASFGSMSVDSMVRRHPPNCYSCLKVPSDFMRARGEGASTEKIGPRFARASLLTHTGAYKLRDSSCCLPSNSRMRHHDGYHHGTDCCVKSAFRGKLQTAKQPNNHSQFFYYSSLFS